MHRGADSKLTLDGLTLPQIAKGFRYSSLDTMLNGHIKWQKHLLKKQPNRTAFNNGKSVEKPSTGENY